MLVFSFIAFIYFLQFYFLDSDFKNDSMSNVSNVGFFLILNIIIIILSFSIRFPLCSTNRKYSTKENYSKEVDNLPLLISRFISYLVSCILLMAFLVISNIKESHNDNSIYNKIKGINITSLKKIVCHKNLTIHSFCYSEIHNMSIYFYLL